MRSLKRILIAVGFGVLLTIAWLWYFGPPPWNSSEAMLVRAERASNALNEQLLRPFADEAAGQTAEVTARPVAGAAAAVAAIVPPAPVLTPVTPVLTPVTPVQAPTATPLAPTAAPTAPAPTATPPAVAMRAMPPAAPASSAPSPMPVPPGGVYAVRPGDSLQSIAERYGTTVQAILEANGLNGRQFVWVGQPLAIPGGRQASGVYSQASNPMPAAVADAALTAEPAEAATPAPAPRRKPTATPKPGLPGKLVFQTATGMDIYVIHADGTGLQHLTQGMEPALSPDGNWVAFTRWGEQDGIYLIRADGAEEHKIFGIHQPRQPAWSPDGAAIAFSYQQGSQDTETHDKNGKLYRNTKFFWRAAVVNVDGSGFGELPAKADQNFSPTWAPDGKTLVFAGGEGLVLAGREGFYRELTHGAWQQSPAWSRDGARIAFMIKRNDHFDLFVRPMGVDLAAEQPSLSTNKGIEIASLTNQPMYTDRPINSVSPTWSPDGKQLAFLTDRDGPWQIYVMNGDGSDPHPMFDPAVQLPAITYDFVAEKSLDWGN